MLPISRKDNIVVQEAQNETLVYDLLHHKAFLLNKTSALVWNSLDGKTSIEQITRILSEHNKQTASEELVWLAIDELDSNNLLTNNGKLNNPLRGLSRRQVVKKVGTASLIALPMVLSLAVPTAAQSVSCKWGLGCQPPGTIVCPDGCNGTFRFQSCVSSDGSCSACSPSTFTQVCGSQYTTVLDFILVSHT